MPSRTAEPGGGDRRLPLAPPERIAWRRRFAGPFGGALLLVLGLLPLALGSGEAGREIEGPMAVIILAGLATSSVLNLLVLPSLSVRFGRFDRDDPGPVC